MDVAHSRRGCLLLLRRAHRLFEEIAKFGPLGGLVAGCATSTAPRPTRRSGALHTPTAGGVTDRASAVQHVVRTASRGAVRRARRYQLLQPTRSTRCSRCRPSRPPRSPCGPNRCRRGDRRRQRRRSPGRSWYVEALTDRIEAEAEAIFEKIREMGATETRWAQAYGPMTAGILRGIEDGWFMSEIAESAFWYQQQVEKGDKRVVGVNVHTDTITSATSTSCASRMRSKPSNGAPSSSGGARRRRRGDAGCCGSDGRGFPRKRQHDPVDAGRRSLRGTLGEDLRCARAEGCVHGPARF